MHLGQMDLTKPLPHLAVVGPIHRYGGVTSCRLVML